MACTVCTSVLADVNYCDDPAVDVEWESIIAGSNGAPEPLYMYRLRERLCDRVRSGELPLDTAIDHFESERDRRRKGFTKWGAIFFALILP